MYPLTKIYHQSIITEVFFGIFALYTLVNERKILVGVIFIFESFDIERLFFS